MAVPFGLTLRLRSLGATALATIGAAALAVTPLSVLLRRRSLGEVLVPANVLLSPITGLPLTSPVTGLYLERAA